MRFRKRPVIIEATRWLKAGDHPNVSTPTIDGYDGKGTCRTCGLSMRDHGWIDTLEGGHIVCPGDWIITGVAGEHYPCKPDIFEQTYEPVE